LTLGALLGLAAISGATYSKLDTLGHHIRQLQEKIIMGTMKTTYIDVDGDTQEVVTYASEAADATAQAALHKERVDAMKLQFPPA
jgi:uncharacterized protein YabE (DUF348 family)